MDALRIEGTLLEASADTRILRYRLLPFGEVGRTNKGSVIASRGALTLPADPGELIANFQHDRNRPVSRFVSIEETDDGLYCSVRALNTAAGNDLLAEATEGVRRGISVELANEVIRNGHLTSGILVGAGHVVAPAFPSALLVAADTEPEPTTPTPVAPAPVAPSPAPPEATPEENSTVTEPTLTASAPTGMVPRPTRPTDMSADAAFRFLADAYRDGAGPGLQAALSDITVSGIGANIIQPAWLAELWSGRTYNRRYVPLVTNQPLRGMTLKGWKWTTKPAVAAYAGNKAAVTSNTPVTAPVSVAVQRLAGAHDVDRAYTDFQVTDFWESYYRAMTDSYAMLSDAACATDLIAAATVVAAPGSGLSTWTPAQTIVEGALAVIAANGTPTAAIVGTDLYKTLLLTPQQNMIQLLSGGLGLTQSQAEGFVIVPGPAALTGKALVLDKGGFVFAELPGSPIRVEALNQANGGVDPGVFGYFADYSTDATLIQLHSKPTA